MGRSAIIIYMSASEQYSGTQALGEQQGLIETELEDTRQRQIQRLLDLGFHESLGMSENDYLASFPDFPERLPAYGQILDTPLLVDPRVRLSDQHKQLEIRGWADPSKTRDITKVPETPYAIWTHGRLLGPGAVDKLRDLDKPKRNALSHAWEASPQVEVTALWIQQPDVFEGHGFEAIGSRGPLPHPSISDFADDHIPMFQASRTAFSGVDWEGLHRGKNINIGR